MSDQLIIKMGGQIIETVSLDRPMMRIGRGDGCDILLNDPEKRVSRFHAVIQRSAGRDEFKIKNDEGKTGVLVNNNRADDWTVLKRGDLIQIGPFSLIYTFGAGAGADDDATMVGLDDATVVGGAMDYGAAAAGAVGPKQPATVQHEATMAMPGGVGSAVGAPLKLVFVKGPFKGGQQTVTAPSFTIGRGQDQNAVWLKDDTVSTQHAEISQVAGKYFIKDLGSQNGLLVNGKKVMGECDLKNGDKITIGLSTFKVASGGGGGGGAVKFLGMLVGALVMVAVAYMAYIVMSDKGGDGDGGGTDPAGGSVVAQEGDGAPAVAPEPPAVAPKSMAPKPEPPAPAPPVAIAPVPAPVPDPPILLPEPAVPNPPAPAPEPPVVATLPEPAPAPTPAPAPEPPPVVVDTPPAPDPAPAPEPVPAAPEVVSTPTPAPEPAPGPTPTPPAAAPATGFTFAPIDPARKIAPSEVIEYKPYK